MPATRADVARLAGVSPALVSYVLNNGPRKVSPEARARIERAIETLGYRPNAVAQALRGLNTRLIGLLTPAPTNAYFAELAECIERRVFDSGNLLLIGMTNEDPSRELRYVNAFVDRRVDGLLVISSRVQPMIARAAEGVPAVAVDRASAAPGFSSVCINSVHGAQMCVEHLQGHGIRTIACVAGPRDLLSSEDRIRGWRRQQDRLGLPASEDLVANAPFTEEGGYAALRELIDLGPFADALRAGQPLGLFVSSDVQAIGVLRACSEQGIRVPEDIAIASFDGTRLGASLVPPLTSFRQPLETIAAMAVEELQRRVASADLEPRDLTVEGNLRIGRSCGCA
jgi:LacI family transcriptional regulator